MASVGLRSETCRARRRAEKRTKYRGTDKADLIDRLIIDQQGKCASCEGDGGPRGLVLDHNHETGEARLLLCVQCNAAFGLLHESPNKIRGLLEYALALAVSH